MKAKTLISTIAISLFAAGASAGDIYNGWSEGNSDLYSGSIDTTESVVASQPGIGSDFDRYHGFADGNSDLFGDREVSSDSVVRNSEPADVYRGFAGNPDLSH